MGQTEQVAGGLAKQALQLAAFTGLAEGAAFLARPKGSSSWALRLARKPTWEVPDRAMAPLWIGGFGLLGLSGYAAWRGGARSALPWWGAYLAGIPLWNRLGFDLGNHATKNLFNMGLLGTYAVQAGRQSKAARWLALPFVAWLGYVALGTRATRKRNPLLSRFF